MEAYGETPVPQRRVQAPGCAGILGDEILHGLTRRHDISRNLVRVWVEKYEATAAIEAKRPVTATDVVVVAPAAHLVNFSIGLSPDSVATREAVLAALDDLLIREAEPGGTLPRSRISAAISAAAGEYSHTLAGPVGDIVSPPGEIARRGVVTWL